MPRSVLLLSIVLATLLAATTPAKGEIVSLFESPANNQVVQGVNLIRGWTFSTARAPVTLWLYIDGEEIDTIPCCSKREDVGISFSQYPQAQKSGWGITVNWGNFTAGRHAVRIDIRAGSETWSQTHQVVVVRLGDFSFLSGLDLSEAVFAINGDDLVISGAIIEDQATGVKSKVNLHLRWRVGSQGFEIVSSLSHPLGVVDFVFGANVSRADEELIRETVALGDDYFASMQGTIVRAYTVIVFSSLGEVPSMYCYRLNLSESDCSAAYTAWKNGRLGEVRRDHLFLHTGGRSWETRTEGARRKVIFHEQTHQAHLSFNGNGYVAWATWPRWLAEGSAEHLADMANNDYGFLPLEMIRGVERTKLTVNIPLERLEDTATFHALCAESSSPWSIVTFAVAFLERITGKSALAIWQFGNRDKNWKDAFRNVYGITVEDFYTAFAQLDLNSNDTFSPLE